MRKTLMARVISGILLMALIFELMPGRSVLAAPKEENAGNSQQEQTGEASEMAGEAESGELAALAEDGMIQEAEEGAEENEETVPPAGAPDRIRPEYEETSYEKDFFFSKATMQGIFSNSGLYFYVPEYWETEYVYAELEYRVSQIIQDAGSTMTFYVNQSPVSSCEITYEGGDSQIIYVKVPMELIQQGYNSFTITAYSNPNGSCTDAFSSANWLSLSEHSHIRCGYEVKDHGHEIAYYPYPFLSTIDETGKGLTIAVSDRAENDEVAAAMNLMADLSSRTASENLIRFAMISDRNTSEKGSTILVSKYDNLPADYQEKVPDLGTDKAADQGIVVFTDDEEGNPLMIITSGDGECLLEAVYMLMDEDRVSQEKGNVAKVMAGSAAIAGDSETDQMAARYYTLKDLNGGGLDFVGLFHKEQIIYLPFSEDYYLSESGSMTLQFRYSDNLDFNKSLMSVYLGEIPIASKKLDREKAAGDELNVTIPKDLAGVAAGSIKITFDLELEDMACSLKQDQMPWAYVSEKSQFYLPVSSEFDLSFDAKPLPFRRAGKFNDVLLILSDEPDSSELNLYAQIVGMYGAGVEPYGTFAVKRAGEFSENDADYNIITAGTYENNNYLKAINENLYFPYHSSGKSFQSNEQLILSGDYSGKIAIMQLLESPYASGRGILAVTGANEAALSYAEEIIKNEKLRGSLSRDCVIIDQDLEIRSYRFITNASGTQEPTLAETLNQNKQSVLFTIVATSVMLMLLIAVIIILLRIKMYHKKQDRE